MTLVLRDTSSREHQGVTTRVGTMRVSKTEGISQTVPSSSAYGWESSERHQRFKYISDKCSRTIERQVRGERQQIPKYTGSKSLTGHEGCAHDRFPEGQRLVRTARTTVTDVAADGAVVQDRLLRNPLLDADPLRNVHSCGSRQRIRNPTVIEVGVYKGLRFFWTASV